MHRYPVPINPPPLLVLLSELSPTLQNPTTPGQYDIAECTHTQCQSTPIAGPTELIKPNFTEPYYTRTVGHYRMKIYPVPIYPPVNQNQVYKTLLHQDSRTLQNEDIPSANFPPLIEPSDRLPYYTRSV